MSENNGSGSSHSAAVNGIIEDLMGGASNNDGLSNSHNEKITSKKKTSVSKTNSLSGSGKVKKRKTILRDNAAPKQPLTGYFRFLNDRRDKCKTENPTLPFSEITKQLAAAWNVLPVGEKQQYLDAAEKDKERYSKEFEEYKKTDAYKTFLQKKAAKKKKDQKKDQKKDKKFDTDVDSVKTKNKKKKESKKKKEKVDDGTFEIPIFTQEFLEHNKQQEADLRELRKTTADFESQNSVLELHIERLKTAIERLEVDTNERKDYNEILQAHLDMLRNNFLSCFAHMPLPDMRDILTADNIDLYVEKLNSLLETRINLPLCNAVISAASQLDFSK
ncbi:hypothetical protein TKK_0012397 [Trichogramma kaykai]|uniref:HMG box domain-containing protein n=1 Tax=Trichogramma kaykai TaxID=54128 RepID=A0ABD2WNC6_9HYME